MRYPIPDGHYLLGVYHVVDKHPFNESDSDESENSGLYRPDGRCILIDSTQPEHTHAEIHLHECIEGINDMADLGLKHWQICILALALNDLIRNQLVSGAE